MIMFRTKMGAIVALILALFIVLAGCNPGGEINLINGYYILEATGSWCVLEKTGDTNCNIPNFYITGYAVSDPYILLEGITTAYLYIDDAELDSSQRTYYIVDTNTNIIYGELESKLQLQYKCDELAVEKSIEELEWKKTGRRSCVFG